MPPAVCLPPTILDQSFPRELSILQRVVETLGALERDVDNQSVVLLLTEATEMYVADFNWQEVTSYPILQVIHSLIVQWLLQPNAGVRLIPTNDGCTFPHPIPEGSGDGPLIALWRDEIGFLFDRYQRGNPGTPFVGIACINAFSKEPLGQYETPNEGNQFPLVGPDEIPTLSSIYVWQIDTDLHQRSVSYAAARKNLPLLGAVVAPRPVGSHYKVTIPGAPRSWPLDCNFDVVPDHYLRELEPIARLPFDVIKSVLLNGTFPPMTDRLQT